MVVVSGSGTGTGSDLWDIRSRQKLPMQTDPRMAQQPEDRQFEKTQEVSQREAGSEALYQEQDLIKILMLWMQGCGPIL